MIKLVRCTVCTWRGTRADAEAAPPPRRSDIPPPLEAIQRAYTEANEVAAGLGARRLPQCPSCGHNLTPVLQYRRRSSIHPT